MTERIAIGVVLVLVTWTVAAAATAAAGLLPALVVDRRARAEASLRGALWWGAGVLTLVTLATGLVTPLRGPAAAITVTCVLVALVITTVFTLRSRLRALTGIVRRPGPAVLALLAMLALVAAYLALKALGPPTNYDTGLYHLGAIAYAGDYATIPGLANLYFPFGYDNSIVPVAALLGNGPWDGLGYRLVNGLLGMLVMADLAIRLLARRWSWGTFLLLAAVASCFVPLIAMADFWVSSPTSDTAILLLSVVSCAYLADFVGARRNRSLNASVVAVTSLLMVAMRPTMLFFTAGAALVVLAVSIRARREPDAVVTGMAWGIMSAFALALGAVQLVRDYVLSGWLLYPLSLVAFDVPWRAGEPTIVRNVTMAAARDPSRADSGPLSSSWDWIPAWISRLGSQWETYFITAGVLVAVAVVVVAYAAGARLPVRRAVLVMMPSAIATLAWFTLTPPSFRFGWGPIFTLFLIPLSAALTALDRRGRQYPGLWSHTRTLVLAGTIAVLVAVTGFSLLFRSQVTEITQERSFAVAGLSLPYAVAPVPLPDVTAVTTAGGADVIRPTTGDQCWSRYPLCTPLVEEGLAMRGESIQDGFIH